MPANSYKKHKILRRTLALNITSKGDFVTVKVEGNDETEAANVLENYFKENL